MNTKTISIAQRLSIGAIGVYQFLVSPVLGQRCRYHPTCSSYAAEAIARHGVLLGSWYGLKRLVRCHPWSEGGVDPVPSEPHSCSSTLDAKLER